MGTESWILKQDFGPFSSQAFRREPTELGGIVILKRRDKGCEIFAVGYVKARRTCVQLPGRLGLLLNGSQLLRLRLVFMRTLS